MKLKKLIINNFIYNTINYYLFYFIWLFLNKYKKENCAINK